MKLVFSSVSLENQCRSTKSAVKVFGGNKDLATSLLSRINAIEQSETIHDIIAMRTFRFHKLKNKGKHKILDGYFAIDVKTRADAWRVILQPLDEFEKPFDPCDIDKISRKVKIVKIVKVSKHYD